MKFEKPKSKDIGSGVASVAGATLGFIAPNGIANAVAKIDNEAIVSDKQKTTKMYVNAGCLVVGIALAMAVKGDDLVAAGVRGTGFGLAGGGAKGLITHFAKDNLKAEAGTTAGRLMAGALGCPCEDSYEVYPSYQMPRALAMPSNNSSAYGELDFAM